MTVKKLNDQQKEVATSLYAAKLYDIQALAHMFNVSERTMNRVMMERGVNPARKTRSDKGKTHNYPIHRNIPTLQDAVVPSTPQAVVIPMQIEMLPEPTFMEKTVSLLKRALSLFFPVKETNGR